MTEQPLVEMWGRKAWMTYRKTRAMLRERFGTASHPYTEISRTPRYTEIVLKLPWTTKSKDVKIIVGPGMLEVYAKVRSWGAFYRKIELAKGVGSENIRTTFRGGKLSIQIPHD